MGHKVSTISNDEPPRRHVRTMAALAVIIAIQYATASTTQCAFTAPSLHKRHVHSSSLFATASIASAIIASVPPPGSKLYQLRNDGRGNRRPSGSSSDNHKRGRTHLRYATHVDSSSSCPPSQEESNHLSLQLDDEQPQHSITSRTSNVNSTQNEPPLCQRKRQRMMKYLDRQFSRLDVKLSKPKSVTNSTDYQRRKAAWAAKYTSISSLRSTFGSNKNRFWGDFDPVTTRKLYHTLIPRALLALHDMGLSDVDELAPLAYQARMAAKKYARERSRLPGRIGSMFYDGWRQWRRYGKWKFDGMTWEQIWDKYENQILRETVGERFDLGREEACDDVVMQNSQMELNDEELTAKICLRILERSVVTNEMIDKLFLERLYGKKDDDEEDADEEASVDTTPQGRKQRRQERRLRRTQQIQADLKAIEQKFDDDIRELLRHGGLTTEAGDLRRKNRNNGSFFWSKDESTTYEDDESEESYTSETTLSITRGGGEEDLISTARFHTNLQESASAHERSESQSKNPNRKLAVHEVSALRILASTRKRIANLQMADENSSAASPPKQ